MEQALVTNIFLKWGTVHAEDWIASGKPCPEILSLPGEQIHPDIARDFGEVLLPATVLPAYVAALAAAVIDRQGLEGSAGIEAFYELLSTNLGHLPMFGWMFGMYLLAGTPSVRRELRTGLFKLQKQDIRKSCMSASWDIGYLQMMSIARIPALASIFALRTPVLVTDDNRLGPSSVLPRCIGNTGAFVFDEALIDSRWRADVRAVLQRVYRERAIKIPTEPTWEECSAAVALLEPRLGVQNSSPLSLQGETTVVRISAEAMIRWLKALKVERSFDAIHPMIRDEFPVDEAIVSGAVVVAGLIKALADFSGATLTNAIEDVLRPDVQEYLRSPSFQAAARLGLAVAKEDLSMQTAMLARTEIAEDHGWVALYTHHVGRRLVGSLAEHRGIPVETQIEEFLGRLAD